MTSRPLASLFRARIVFPALTVAMGLATIVGGLEHSRFLASAAGVEGALSAPLETGLDSVLVPARTLDSVVTIASSRATLDVDMEHHRIDDWVRRLTTSLRGDFTQSLDRMDKYAAMINRKLDERQMPRELIYVALIESNFNPNARSKVGAVGMWQFMSATAREFGLTVTGRTDERKNPAEATDAALTYLSKLHDRFGSWYLAAAAYNSGQGTVARAMKKVTGRTKGTDEDFFRILSSLPRETQEYVPKLIASARVGSDMELYGMTSDGMTND